MRSLWKFSLVILVLALCCALYAEPVKFVRYPHICQDKIAFTYHGDIWVANADGRFNGIPVRNDAYSAIRICHGIICKGNNCLVSGCRICSGVTPDDMSARYRYGIEAPNGSVGHVFVDNIISGYWIAPISWH